MARDDDTPTRGQEWGPGFLRGFEVGVSRFGQALRDRMLSRDFRAAGWDIGDIEAFVAEVARSADAISGDNDTD